MGGVLVCCGFRAVQCVGLVARCAAHPALCADARRNSGDSIGTTVCRSIGAGVESSSLMRDRRVVLGAALAFVGIPVITVPIEAVAFYSANRENGSFVSSDEKREYVLYVPK